jgi:hypothetical protein
MKNVAIYWIRADLTAVKAWIFMVVQFLAQYDSRAACWLDTSGSDSRVVPKTLEDNPAGTGGQNFPY